VGDDHLWLADPLWMLSLLPVAATLAASVVFAFGFGICAGMYYGRRKFSSAAVVVPSNAGELQCGLSKPNARKLSRCVSAVLSPVFISVY
jgi:hypothetical protein